jgi:hypothetical protein
MRLPTLALLLAASFSLGGCTIITVAAVAGSLAMTAGGLAVDAAVGTVKFAADVVTPDGDDKEKKK